MSIESEIQYLLTNCPLPAGDELHAVLPGTVNGGGFSNWDGIIAVSDQRLFFSSEPGFVSDGAVVYCGMAAVNWIKQEGAVISAQIHMDDNRRRNISVTVDNYALDPNVAPKVSQLVDFVKFCRANSVGTAFSDEYQRAFAGDDAEQALSILENVAAKDAISAIPHAWMAVHLTDLGRFD